MRIAVASNDGWGITGPLGHALRFLIYERQGTTLWRIGFRPLKATGPCPCQSAELFQLLKDCQVVMAGGMSQSLFDQLIGRGIRPVVTPELSADQAVRRFVDGTLAFGEATPCDCQH